MTTRSMWRSVSEWLRRANPLDLLLHVKARQVSLFHRSALALRAMRTSSGRSRVGLGILARCSRAVHALAYRYRRTLAGKVRVVAVVGSFGKTTTTRAVTQAFGNSPPTWIGWNSGVGVSAALLRIRPWFSHAAIEVGIAQRNQMERYAQLLRPDIVVVTCIGSEHHNSLGTAEMTRGEKAKMVEALPARGLAVLNADDPHVCWMRDRTRASVVTFGLGESADVRAVDVAADSLDGLRFTVHLAGKTHRVETRLIGRHMAYPVLAALAVAHGEGVSMELALSRLKELESTPNRLQPIRHPSGAWILLDAFKAAEETIDRALDVLEELDSARKIVVLGDVEEPRGSQGPIYWRLGLRVAEVAERALFVGGKTNFNRLKVGTQAGGLPREHLTNIRGSPLEAVVPLATDLGSGDLVLIKGRSTQHLERISLGLLGREIGCKTKFCRRRHDCATCPLLKKGR